MWIEPTGTNISEKPNTKPIEKTGVSVSLAGEGLSRNEQISNIAIKMVEESEKARNEPRYLQKDTINESTKQEYKKNISEYSEIKKKLEDLKEDIENRLKFVFLDDYLYRPKNAFDGTDSDKLEEYMDFKDEVAWRQLREKLKYLSEKISNSSDRGVIIDIMV